MVVLVALVAAAIFAYRLAGDGTPVPARVTQSAPAEASANVLRFPAGSPQLAYIRAEAAEAKPEPLVEALPGRIAYDENRTARVTAPVAGRVTTVVVQLGESVSKGQTLALIDSPDFTQALADSERAQLDLRQKRHVFDREKLLFEGEVAPRKEYESAQTDLEEAEVEVSRTRKRLEELGQGSPGGQGQFVLRAPVAGVITERSMTPGTQVGPGADPPLFVISDPTQLRVIVDVPEQQIAALRVGQDIAVEVDAYPHSAFTAKVVSVGDVLDPVTRRVQVRCSIHNPERQLKPEMYARVTPIATGQPPRVRVPNAAVVVVGVKNFVFVETGPGTFERRLVVPSSQGREFTFLKEGLQAGERVVVSGALLLNSELQGN